MSTSADSVPAQTDQVLRVVSSIVGLVEQRAYGAGDRIPSEREFSERFGVGRAVVREATAMLEAMRYLERRRGSGLYLSADEEATSLETLVLFSSLGLPVSKKVNDDSIEVRRLIEGQAIRLACLRRQEANLERLQQILRSFDDVADARAASDYDFRFHMEIFRATGNEILVRLVHPFYIMSRQRREAFFSDEGRRSVSHAQHEEIFRAIAAQDAEMAASLMNMHIGRVDTWFHKVADGAPAGPVAALWAGSGQAPDDKEQQG